MKANLAQGRELWELCVRLVLLMILVPSPLTMILVGAIVGKKVVNTA